MNLSHKLGNILYFTYLNIHMDMKINKNHLLFLVLTCLIILSSCSDSLSDTTDERLRYWISTLASDDFEGRAPGTEGGKT